MESLEKVRRYDAVGLRRCNRVFQGSGKKAAASGPWRKRRRRPNGNWDASSANGMRPVDSLQRIL
ncbi:hypothetical protein BSIN_0740 [Burkholderia singularis]|uniref:Uncharacterized protein n=1 Tax=Burkholderia singularis TaxID=1503053 RepID=A0A238H9F8_9BURK|nr:hypothetical protein BSIN_0740 [Burkholderia singularis]